MSECHIELVTKTPVMTICMLIQKNNSTNWDVYNQMCLAPRAVNMHFLCYRPHVLAKKVCHN